MTCIPESGCSSFQFYIKPQLVCGVASVCIGCSSFQFYIKPQRNQLNSYPLTSCSSFQFYIKPQLSSYQNGYKYVVPHSNSTSNHNDYEHYDYPEGLFLIPILHQTTTCRRGNLLIMRCSSFQFYIKPQLNFLRLLHLKGCSSFQFYIKPQLSNTQVCLHRCCSSFQFYIKPQLYEDSVIPISVVPHSNSTSNHNYA